MPPTVPNPARGNPVPLRADDFTPDDLAAISEAGGPFVATLADIAHHHVGEPGFWDCWLDGPYELDRLRRVLDDMATAISDSRRELSRVERRVRRRATRRGLVEG